MDRLSTKGQMIDQIDLRSVPHSGFDRSNHNYGSGKLGAIIPTRLDEVYPGDRIKGRPEVVVNFEPLAAPLMGSMVLKQETFFVPYIQLWRKAYHFFTGKNGFNELMPSISPKDVFDIYDENIHSSVWSLIGADPDQYSLAGFNELLFKIFQFDDDRSWSDRFDETFIQSFAQAVSDVESALRATYSQRKMLDLVLPTLDIFKRFQESDVYLNFASKVQTDYTSVDVELKRAFGIALGDCLFEFFNYFHGPSSLFDYLGWPVPTKLGDGKHFKVDGTPISMFGCNNLISYAIYRNLLVWGSYNLLSAVRGVFSEVPLVFNPFKAYYLVWYWNYRDQLLETDILDPEDDEFLGSTITSDIVLYCTLMRQRCWFKDTFTTSLTNTGDGNLLVPTSSSTNFDTEMTVDYYNDDGLLSGTKDAEQAFNSGATYAEIHNGSLSYKIPMNYLRGSFAPDNSYDNVSPYYVSLDLFDRIKRLRSVVQKRLILGYEVDDVVYSSFLVRMSNVRMHIPEILGRGRDSVQMNTIVNNTSTDQQIAGDKTATAWAHGVQSEMNYFSEEWGLTLSFMTILPIQSYAGGMQRLYFKRDPLDYMWPEYATMGMDAVYNYELAALGTRLTDSQALAVFGYQGRYYDLKSRMDEEHGRLLTDLNYLTFSREWDSENPPQLNYMFVHCWPRLDGFVIDSPLLDVFRYDCYNAQGWERRLPVPSEIVGA